ncbi:MAG: response regulator [Acidobacteriota bacterium]
MSVQPAAVSHPARILIVDDQRQNRQVLEAMLASDGYVLQSASGGDEALAMVTKEPPDLILLDVLMPRTDGYKVAIELKSNVSTKHIPIIMVTALDKRESTMLGLATGAEDILSKPVDREELRARVRNLLRLKAYGEYYNTYSQMLESEVLTCSSELFERTTLLAEQTAILTQQTAFLDLTQDGVVISDMEGRVLFWSRGAEVMTGWPKHEAVGRISFDLLNSTLPESRAQIEAALLRDGQWEGEVAHQRRDGSRLFVHSRWALERDPAGVPVRVLSMNTDIGGRRQADSERQSLTERLSMATATAKVGVWERDIAGGTLTWDATMFEIYGLPPQASVPYATWTRMVWPEDLPALETAFQQEIREKGQGAVEFRITRADGEARDVFALQRIVLDEAGHVHRVIGVNMDITVRKQAAAASERSRTAEMRLKDDFLSRVSHELRSPLTAIKGFTTLLLSGVVGDLNAEQREYEEIVVKNIEQLQSMIDDLLDVTRLGSGKLTVLEERVSLSDAVTDACNTLNGAARTAGITLSTDLPPDLPPAYADPLRVRQVLIILIDNAIKFTPQGGAITVRAARPPQDPALLRVDVADTGRGISEEISERIFERLYQASEATQASRTGLGLGLYICKELVLLQGGQLSVKSQLGAGSTFSFTLPVLSLRPMLAPFFRDGAWPADSVALVSIGVESVDAWPSGDSRQAAASGTRDIVARVLPSGWAMLMPRVAPVGTVERVVVAVFGDARAASALADRIRKQLALDGAEAGRTVSVSYRMLDPLHPDVGASVDAILASMAARLDAAMQLDGATPAPGTPPAPDQIGERVAAMAPAFLERHRHSYQSLVVALKTQDYDLLRRYGHNLKGTGRSYGYPELSDVARALETAAEVKDPQSCRTQIAALDHALRTATP